MNANYCHNCGCWAQLAPATAFCGYCLARFSELGRLPLKSDPVPSTDSLSRLYAAMDWS